MDRRNFIYGIAAGGATLNAGDAPKQPEPVTWKVEGFACITCAAGLEVMLRGQKGVMKADASYKDKKVVIGFDKSLTSEAALKDFIRECGFSVVP
jgi:copper chaperone CopZ